MDYPTEEEEFELMYEDELELLREQEEVEDAPKAKKALNFNELNSQPNNNPPKASQPDKSQDTVINTQNVTNKRSIQELFGDIDDILSENVAPYIKKKRKNAENHDDLALIEHIVQLRKANRERIVPTSALSSENSTPISYNPDNISLSVPKYSFIALMNQEGQRVYIRYHSEMFEKEERERIARQSNFRGVMGSTFNDIWKEAQENINKQFESTSNQESINPEEMLQIENNKDLWVEIYKPKKYYELLSDESTNRTLLKWLKLWDKAVFHRNPKIKQQSAANLKNKPFQKFQKQELILELEPDGRPKYKVALLCGPPGLGKTTLAHMVAKHCGYNIVEINASDDRNLDSFRNALENATSMKSVLDLDKRPNCLVFDEIDGAPTNSIDYLIKFINGIETKKKKSKSGIKHVLKRPIICICNDVYVPSLRNLRQISFIVNFPPTASNRLAERLNEISRHQGIKTDLGALLALAEKTENDIRACLSILHFFKVQNKPVTLSDVWKMNIGQKDMQKGLFAVWQDIFQIERAKTAKNRSKKILNTVQSFGDYERLTQGIFENFPTLQIKDSSLLSTVEAEEWFCFNDILNRRIQSQQDYSLSVYLPFGFVTWHLAFAGFVRPKISYPNAWFEMRTKAQKREGLIKEVLKGMKPSVKIFVQSNVLNLEILPYLSQIIVPPLRPVNLHFCTEQEKEVLKNVVNIMIDYNLNYVQERTFEGNYVYNVDPNIEEVTVFSLSTRSRTLSYSNKQMIGQEIDVEKMRRIERAKFKEDKKEKKKNEVPNHLQKLQVKNVKPKGPMVTKDFFGRIIIKDVPQGDAATTRNDVWFQFKEGHTNAVRKPVKIKHFF
ncbi:chromosome transmission fidelity protein 18 homolog [Onthophagus taurus]|uniref:chromosome transmission fidelity protein 18 homolog n=1 Tax=Onthophagus taurus TaxID=166361 RepID=UPI0039BDEC9B